MYAVLWGVFSISVILCVAGLILRAPSDYPARKPDYKRIRALEIELGFEPSRAAGADAVLKDAYTGKPGEVIWYDGHRHPPQWEPVGPLRAITRAMTDADVEASRRHRRYDDEAQQLFESMCRIAGR